MANVFIVSITGMSSMRCAASPRLWPHPSIAMVCFPGPNMSGPGTRLSDALPRKEACRRMVDLLWLAHSENCQAELAALIAKTLAAGKLPDAKTLRLQLARSRVELPEDRAVRLKDLSCFDNLLESLA